MPAVITNEMVFAALPPRPPESHKGAYGRVLAVCGCPAYRGAAALSVLGALRAGAGVVTLAAGESVIQSIAARVLEATFLPLPDESALASMAETATGLCSLAAEKQAMRPAAGRLIVTPHPGEMARLAHTSVQQVLAAPAETALAMAKQLDAVVVLKGHRTLTATPAGRLYENRTGNAGLARGGDVLAGMIAGLAAQGLAPAQAAVCGVYLHGLAADRCAARLSQQGMLPEDILADLCALYLENGR